MKLIRPTSDYKESWGKALAEFQAEGAEEFWNLPAEPVDFQEYKRKTKEHSYGKNLPPEGVPSSTFWLVDKGVFIAHINIRHQLNEFFENVIGHIGYAVRPSERKKGYGTKLLELGLKKAKQIGLDKVFITCDETNIGSKIIIEENGGEFQDKVPHQPEKKLRYWIYL